MSKGFDFTYSYMTIYCMCSNNACKLYDTVRFNHSWGEVIINVNISPSFNYWISVQEELWVIYDSPTIRALGFLKFKYKSAQNYVFENKISIFSMFRPQKSQH